MIASANHLWGTGSALAVLNVCFVDFSISMYSDRRWRVCVTPPFKSPRSLPLLLPFSPAGGAVVLGPLVRPASASPAALSSAVLVLLLPCLGWVLRLGSRGRESGDGARAAAPSRGCHPAPAPLHIQYPASLACCPWTGGRDPFSTRVTSSAAG